MTGNTSVGVYAAEEGGYLYKRTGRTGTFEAVTQAGQHAWRCMASKLMSILPSHYTSVYAGIYGGDIYMQSEGTGDFVAQNQTSRNWTGLAFNNLPAGEYNVYACVYGGLIYYRHNDIGDFGADGVNTTPRNWSGMCQAASGTSLYSIMACVYGGDIYGRRSTGVFEALGQTSRNWVGITRSGDSLYGITAKGEIYRQYKGIGAFALMYQPGTHAWSAVTGTDYGDLYAADKGGDIYESAAPYYSASYVAVSGAGTTSVNGTYNYAAIIQGVPVFSNGACLLMTNTISEDVCGRYTSTSVASPDTVPPETGWGLLGASPGCPAGGTAPVPTVVRHNFP